MTPDELPVVPDPDQDRQNRRAISKGVWVRAFIYVIGLHVFGGFIMLLFFIGQHRH